MNMGVTSRVEIVGDGRLMWLDEHAYPRIPNLGRIIVAHEATTKNMADMVAIRLLDPDPISRIVILPSVNGMFDISYDVNMRNIIPGPRSAKLRDTSIEGNVCKEMSEIYALVDNAYLLQPDVSIVIGAYYGLDINAANMRLGLGTHGHETLSEEIVLRLNMMLVEYNKSRGMPTPRVDKIIHCRNPINGRWTHRYNRLYDGVRLVHDYHAQTTDAILESLHTIDLECSV